MWILNKKERLKPVCPISTESVGDYASEFAFSFPLWPHYVLSSFCFSVSGKLFATASSSCANVLTVRSSTSGMIYSNRDGSHSDNMYCSWSIFSNTNLELIFFRLDTESSFDSVYVYDVDPRPHLWSGNIMEILRLQPLQAHPISFLSSSPAMAQL